MSPLNYFKSLSEDQKLAYANRSGCSLTHMRSNLFVQKSGVKKQPRPELLMALIEASEGQVSLEEAIQYFLIEPVLRLAAQKQRVALSIGKFEQGGDESCAWKIGWVYESGFNFK